MTKEANVGFGLRKILTEQFAIIENSFIENETIQLAFGLQFAIDAANRMIGCSTNFQFQINESPFIILKIKVEVEVEEAAWDRFVVDNQQSIVFAKDFMRHIAVITIGTARGVLHAKTENTDFNKYFLPTVNVEELVFEDISFTLES